MFLCAASSGYLILHIPLTHVQVLQWWAAFTGFNCATWIFPFFFLLLKQLKAPFKHYKNLCVKGCSDKPFTLSLFSVFKSHTQVLCRNLPAWALLVTVGSAQPVFSGGSFSRCVPLCRIRSERPVSCCFLISILLLEELEWSSYPGMASRPPVDSCRLSCTQMWGKHLSKTSAVCPTNPSTVEQQDCWRANLSRLALTQSSS